jgi:uncharacterized protein YecE (DUF72 family)
MKSQLAARKLLYVGCAIWAHKGWVGNFFPEKTKAADFLREYSRRLTAVEGNTTFYAIPSEETIKRWVEQTPDDFRFCPKMPKPITHGKRLKDTFDETKFFLERMSGLGERLGPLFIQLPPSFGPASFDTLAAYLGLIPNPYRVCVEVRHDDWFKPAQRARLNALLQQQNAAKVIIDTRGLREGETDDVLINRSRERKPDVPVQPDLTADFAFVRLINNPKPELNETYIAEWAARIAQWIEGGVQVFLFAHCPVEVWSPVFAREMHTRVAALTRLEPLPGQFQQSALL